MNKAAAGAIAALVTVTGLAAGSFAWTGGSALNELRAQTAALGKLSPALKVVDEKVERGLFRSTYDVTVQLGCMPALPAVPGVPPPATSGEPIELSLHTELRHGPVLPSGLGAVALESELRVPEKWRARLETLTGKEPPLRVATRVGFDRHFRSEFTVPALHFRDDEAGSFDSDVVRGSVTGDAIDSTHGARYTFELPGFAFHTRTPDASLDVQLGRMQGDQQVAPHAPSASWLLPTRGQGSIAELTFRGSAASSFGGPPTPLTFSLNKLAFQQESTLERGLWSSSLSYTGEGRFNDFKIDRVELKGGLRRLEAATYQKLLGAFFEHAFSCDPALREGGVEALFPRLERDVVALLMHDPEYGLDSLAVELSGQRAELSYTIGVQGVTPADAQRSLMELALTHGRLKARARVQLGLLDVIDAQLAQGTPSAAPPGAAGTLRSLATLALAQFGEAGLVVQSGDAIETAVSYQDGQLLVNGKPPVLPDLGALLGAP